MRNARAVMVGVAIPPDEGGEAGARSAEPAKSASWRWRAVGWSSWSGIRPAGGSCWIFFAASLQRIEASPPAERSAWRDGVFAQIQAMTRAARARIGRAGDRDDAPPRPGEPGELTSATGAARAGARGDGAARIGCSVLAPAHRSLWLSADRRVAQARGLVRQRQAGAGGRCARTTFCACGGARLRTGDHGPEPRAGGSRSQPGAADGLDGPRPAVAGGGHHLHPGRVGTSSARRWCSTPLSRRQGGLGRGAGLDLLPARAGGAEHGPGRPASPCAGRAGPPLRSWRAVRLRRLQRAWLEQAGALPSTSRGGCPTDNAKRRELRRRR